MFICFPGARVLVKGFIGMFIEDQAKTPEGARAIYQQAIDEATQQYSKANDVLQKLTGKLSTAVNDKKALQKQLEEVEKKCENAVNRNLMEDAELYALQREDVLIQLEPLDRVIDELTVSVKEAQEINKMKESQLNRLKKEKDTIVQGLIMNKQLKEIYDDMDELKAISSTSKMVNSIREGSKSLREEAVGARAVHNNKTSTKVAQADTRSRQTQTSSYIEELKKKKQQGQK